MKVPMQLPFTSINSIPYPTGLLFPSQYSHYMHIYDAISIHNHRELLSKLLVMNAFQPLSHRAAASDPALPKAAAG